MPTCQITLRVRVAWWLRAYLWSVARFSEMTGMEPDMGKVERMIRMGVKVKEQ